MKTTQLIFAFSLALIFATGFNSSYAKSNSRTDIPGVTTARQVTYHVRIENMIYINNTKAKFLVVMTDENGRQIGNAQTFRPGLTDYTFFETGTVHGTRVARLIKFPLGPSSYDIPPCFQSGVFYGGSAYKFTINAIPVSHDTGVDNH